jgi:hypothetical protein
MTIPPEPKNCCCCNLGAYVPRLKNVTQVRTQSDCTDPATKAVATANGSTIPAARLDNTYDTNPGGAGSCSGGVKCGLCGGWLAGGDYNGLPAQEVTAGTDDIVAGATPDATHYTEDNNSYQAYPNAAASFFQVGDIAKIVSLGSTDWHAMGASATPAVNDIFTVTVTGSGSGTAQLMADMLMARRRGGNWIFAQKYWHGTPSWLSKDVCTLLPTNAVDTTRYLIVDYEISSSVTFYVEDSGNHPTVVATQITSATTGGMSVDQHSGVITNTLVTSEDGYGLYGTLKHTKHTVGGVGWTMDRYTDVVTNYNSGMTTQLDTDITDYHCTYLPIVPATGGQNIASFIDTWAAIGATPLPAITDYNNYSATSSYTSDVGFITASISLSWTRTATAFTWSLSYDYKKDVQPEGAPGENERQTFAFSGTATLSNPYSDSILAADFSAAFNAWDMSDFKYLNSLRTDENLAHSALCTYAEWQAAVSPVQGFLPATMNNYSSPIADANGYAAWTYAHGGSPPATGWAEGPVGQTANWSPTWAQIAWRDPHDCIWQTQALPAHGIYFTDGSLPELIPANFTNATLRTGIYTGDIIAHTKPIDPATSLSLGICDRHFWMGAVNYRREGSPIMYNAYSHGAYSNEANYTDGTYFEGQLPTPTMRWMPPQNEKFDGAAAGTPPIGNFPQQFTDFSNGCLKGGKYCQAVQKWNAVDYLQPSGKRKFDIAQNTVGVIVAAGSGYFTVGKPSTTSAFPATGYIAVTGSIGVTGIYPVTGAATDNGDHTWNVTVGAKIEDFPTGVYTYGDQRDNVNWLGWLKWLGYTQYAQTFASAPGITGRVAVTTSYATGVLTVATTAAQPYFRKGTDTALRAVNLYDVNGTMLNGSPLVLSRTDDSHFTATTANYPTAVWMVDAALTWAQSGFANASQNTGVHIKWQFDQRQANLATGSQPAWLNGTGAGMGDGNVGCLDSGYSIEQFNYLNGSCPAIVGIVPSGSPENFTPQVLFDFPTVPIDNCYGAHSQSFIGLTMEDPFEIACGTPFKPDFDPMDYTTPLSFSWKEDDGSGHADDPGGSPPVYYYAHRPFVEAADAVPSGKSLPTGVTLFYDPANKFNPTCYTYNVAIGGGQGIPYGHNVTSDWGTTDRICNNVSRFVADYAAWNYCP